MRQVRYGVFETNSSSVHSIAIPRVRMIDIPAQVTIEPMSFGWEPKMYNDVNSRATYLFLLLMYGVKNHSNIEDFGKELEETVKRFNNFFERYGVTLENKIKYKVEQFGNCFYVTTQDCYIDHGDEYYGFIAKRCMEDHQFCANFLFNPQTIIYTGNDNDDSDFPPELDTIIYEELWERY